ncbi:MAG: phosphoglycerate kinase [Parcubacteria group bacterium CG11_big_fil_rev_8_21_14_0_20_39_22]|nr:MAG: phosphoglycerate kinase [Parcubacteria group bacterium CG11_big_fil_rev_8_21_14_0_20_39_22]
MLDLPFLSDDISLEGKKVLLRLDLNMQTEGDRVRDDFRFRKSKPTIDFLINKKAKILLVTHLEDEDKKPIPILPVYNLLKDYYNVIKASTLKSSGEALSKVSPGSVVLLENVRLWPGEKQNKDDFAHDLASLVDLYVGDAFSVCHREHASVVKVPKLLPHYAGFLLKDEISHLSEAFNPKHPFVFILGGAKFETKLPLVEKFISRADTVFVGGALSNDILKASGLEVGNSKVSGSDFGIDKIMKAKNIVTIKDALVESDGRVTVKKIDSIEKQDYIRDAGPETLANLKNIISGAKFILWNGPLGFYERGFYGGTEKLAASIARSDAVSIVGGGDTVAALQTLELEDNFSFVSTGGGAMLDFLANGTLSGIEALRNRF